MKIHPPAEDEICVVSGKNILCKHSLPKAKEHRCAFSHSYTETQPSELVATGKDWHKGFSFL